ncbi:MAG: FAD-binding protein, partial [Chloroflexota bacterium]|nr:FAD-binding protein [Chloroflexota bacterium]
MTVDGAPLAGLTNWAGNHAYRAANLHEPESIEQVQEIVRSARSLRALGTRHSFNDIADTTGDLLSLRRMPRIFDLDRGAGTIRVDGGVRYGELCGPLDAAGFALHSLASLPHISVAGACATATHG